MARMTNENPNRRDQGGWTPLHWAAMEGNVRRIRQLLKAGAKINARDIHGFTPLVIAASEGQAKAVRALINAGAHVNARVKANLHGTALHSAAVWGCDEAVKALLRSKGVRVSLRDDESMTPLEYARLHGHKNIERLLQKNTSKRRQVTLNNL